MKEKRYGSIVILAAVVAIFLAVCSLVRTFAPLCVLPRLTIPTMVQLSLAALLAEHYLCKGKAAHNLMGLVLAAVTFGLLPFAAGFATGTEALKLALVGGVVWFLTAWLFGEVTERLSSGPSAKAAPALSALGLYLAVQGLSGLIL